MLKLTTIDVSKPKGRAMGLSYLMLNNNNYMAWSLKIRVFMHAHGVWEAMKPNDQKSTIQETIDMFALAMIYQGIPEEMLLSPKEIKKAKDV